MEKIKKSLAKQGIPTLTRLLATACEMNNEKLAELIAQAIENEYAEQYAADALESWAAFN
jgi:hypothetical protein